MKLLMLRTEAWYVLPCQERSRSIYALYETNELLPLIVIEDEIYDKIANFREEEGHKMCKFDLLTKDKKLLADFTYINQFDLIKRSHLNVPKDEVKPAIIRLLRANINQWELSGTIKTSVTTRTYAIKRTDVAKDSH